MISDRMNHILDMIENHVRSRPTAFEFEMAYQARVAIDRIRFVIKQTERFTPSTEQSREASLQLLDALERLESAERNFQSRFRRSVPLGEREAQTVNGKAPGGDPKIDTAGR